MLFAARIRLLTALLFLAGLLDVAASIPKTRVRDFFDTAPALQPENRVQVADTQLEKWNLYEGIVSGRPFGFVDGPNLYTYVVQNPWTKFDPEGLASDLSPDGKFHPEAKLYHLKFDPKNPSDPKKLPIESSKDIKIKNAIIFINGMNNPFINAGQNVLNHTEHSEFYLIHNTSDGPLKDIFKECAGERVGARVVIDRTTKDVLKRFDLATASVFAHSQGTMIANHAIEDLVHGGVDTKGMKMYYDGAAANYFATKHIAKEAGATLERFAGHPLDPVHNIIGLNTVNPLRIVGSIIAAPLIFQGDRSWSSHTNLRGGERLQWFNNSVLFK